MAMSIVHGLHTLKQIADSLGIGDKPVTAITIEVKVKELTKVKVEMLLEVPGHDGLCKVLKEYQLVPLLKEKHEIGDEPASEPPSTVDSRGIDEPVRFREFT